LLLLLLLLLQLQLLLLPLSCANNPASSCTTSPGFTAIVTVPVLISACPTSSRIGTPRRSQV
jgi:hypothetical protein